MKGWLEPGELLILSYGLGVYNIKSASEIESDDLRLEYLGIDDIIQTGEYTYVAISVKGHIPSRMEISIQETSEFREDEKFVLNNGSKKMRDRFFLLHNMSTI